MDSDRVFFITTITAQRRPIFRRETTARLLIETLAHYRDEQKYLLHEFVIMPDHLHALLTPSLEISLERAMQFIKGGFSFHLKAGGPVWQASFSNHRVRDPEDYENHREYIQTNPVRGRLAQRGGWPSLHLISSPLHDWGCPVLAFFARAGSDASDAFCFELPRRFCRPYGTRFWFVWPLTRR